MTTLKGGLISYLEEREMQSFKSEDGCMITFDQNPKTHARYLKEDEGEVREWLESVGEDGIIKNTIHPSTFSAMISHRLEEGRTIPDFIKVHTEPAVRFRAGSVATLTI